MLFRLRSYNTVLNACCFCLRLSKTNFIHVQVHSMHLLLLDANAIFLSIYIQGCLIHVVRGKSVADMAQDCLINV